jgi:HAD superfamily hydrolase (TIGR01484 family)
MPERVYLFDVDGTLTHPLTEVDDVFADIFLSWKHDKNKKVYLVTGSDIKKTKRQLFSSFIDQCEGIFTCSGNVFYAKGAKVYENELVLPPGFVENLQLYLEIGTQWRKKTGTHIEIRSGMVNFSTVGRNASPDLREAYYKWDQTTREREDIVEYITGLYPEFEVSIGGTISVDIYPAGKNKAQVVDKLQEIHGPDVEMIFVGDRNVPGGNDWPLAQRLDPIEGSEWYQVLSYEETRALIEYGELFI